MKDMMSSINLKPLKNLWNKTGIIMIDILFSKYIKNYKKYLDSLSTHTYIEVQKYYNILKYIEHRLFDYYEIDSFCIIESMYKRYGEFQYFKTIKKFMK